MIVISPCLTGNTTRPSMRLKARKFAQAAALASFVLCYGTFMVVWSTDRGSSDFAHDPPANALFPDDSRTTSEDLPLTLKRSSVEFQERAPRSVGLQTPATVDNSAVKEPSSIESEESSVNSSIVRNLTSSLNHGNAAPAPVAAPQVRRTFELTSVQDKLKYAEHLKKSKRQLGEPMDAGPNSKTSLKDVFISVKTTKSFHQTRLEIILKTWFLLAREQTYFFSDAEDPAYQLKTNGHLINTNCSSSHNRKALCCKMSVEFDRFIQSGKRWFCHFDDDNYVNIPRLVKLLQRHDPSQDWYLGKPSIRAPLEIHSRHHGDKIHDQEKISFWFATGGAGFCLSRSLAQKMDPIAGGGKFMNIGEKIRLPDDVTIGYIIEYLLSKKLTVIEEFHSHLEPMKFIKQDSFADQITFSYSKYPGQEMNVIPMENGLDNSADPTRLLSLHCALFPHFHYCPKIPEKIIYNGIQT